MSFGRSLTLFFCVSATFSGIWACTHASDDPHEIRIGLLALLQGVSRETSGLPSMRGAQLAIDAVNERGGVELGAVPHHVVLIVKGYDDRPDSASSVARALINQERIDALIGPQFSRHAIPVAVVAENARMPMLSPMSSNPATTRGKEFVFRLAFLDDFQGQVMGHFAVDELGADRAAVLYDISTAYGRSLAAAFREAFEDRGGTVVAFESYARDEPRDYEAPLDRIREANPQVLYLPNDTEFVIAQIMQAREHGIDATLLGGDTWDMERFALKPECEGSFVAHQWHPDLDTPQARAFVKTFRETNGKTPKVTAAMTYDTVALLLGVIENAGSKDPDAIRKGLAGTGEYLGATGTIRFRGTPDPMRSVVISKLHDGRSSLYRVVDP